MIYRKGPKATSDTLFFTRMKIEGETLSEERRRWWNSLDHIGTIKRNPKKVSISMDAAVSIVTEHQDNQDMLINQLEAVGITFTPAQ